ncbi:MAG: F0F1 ATP synthase subunit B [Patescibacteria group bacterium]
MEAILTTFGVDWRLLLINAVNFGLLLAVLTYFLYGPVMRMLEERRARVAKGVKDAEAAGKKLAEIEGSRSEILAHAGTQADEVLMTARAAASKKEREILAEGEAAAEALLKDAEAQAHELKEQALRESKEEVAKLIVLGVEKTLKAKHS